MGVNKSGFELPTSGGTKAELNYYEEESGSQTTTGNTVAWRVVRIGKLVTVSIGYTVFASGDAFTVSSASLSANLRPDKNVTSYFMDRAIGNGSETIMRLTVETSGGMRLQGVSHSNLRLGQAFSGDQTNMECSLSYVLA